MVALTADRDKAFLERAKADGTPSDQLARALRPGARTLRAPVIPPSLVGMIRRTALVGAMIAGMAVVVACVGEDPASPTPGADSGAPIVDGATGAADASGMEDGSAGMDAGNAVDGSTPPCDLQKPFVAKGAIAGLPGVAISELSMDEPEKEAIFTIYRTEAGAHGLFEAKRPLVNEPFGAPAELTPLNVGQARGGTLSPDRQTIIFFSDRGGISLRLFTSKRTGQTTFTEPTEQILTPLESFAVAHPEWIDDSRIVFGTVDETDPKKNKLYRATWNGTSLVTPVEITELTLYQPTRPSMTTGETIIVFQSKLTTTSRIMEARRGSAVPFGAPAEVESLKSAGGEYPLYLSRNGCRLAYVAVGDAAVQWAERGR